MVNGILNPPTKETEQDEMGDDFDRHCIMNQVEFQNEISQKKYSDELHECYEGERLMEVVHYMPVNYE